MNSVAWALIGLTLGIAAVDWWAVASANRPLEYLAKPATMVPLLAAAWAIDTVDSAMRVWFLVALVLSLAGDVFLMLIDDDHPDERLFIAGLGSFLVGHLAYIAGFVVGGQTTGRALLGAVVAAAALSTIGPRIVRGARSVDAKLGPAVSLYVSVIGAMAVAAIGAGPAVAAAGAVLFVTSDAVIGWSRFVGPVPNHRLVIMVTYHLAQVLLVLSLAVAR